MKKLSFLPVAMVILAVWVASCSKNREDTQPATSAQNAHGPESSAIALRAEELGVKFFTEDRTLTDATGLNQVVMRFASADERVLKEYLENTEYSISPITSRPDIGKGLNMAQPRKDPSRVSSLPEGGAFVMTEEVSKRLQPDAIGYATHVKSKAVSNKKARVAYLYSTEHSSPTWPEYGYIECLNNSINVDLRYKDRWYSLLGLGLLDRGVPTLRGVLLATLR